MEEREPIKIQYGGFAPKYYCDCCKKKLYKRNKICPYCLTKKGKVIKINWKGNK